MYDNWDACVDLQSISKLIRIEMLFQCTCAWVYLLSACRLVGLTTRRTASGRKVRSLGAMLNWTQICDGTLESAGSFIQKSFFSFLLDLSSLLIKTGLNPEHAQSCAPILTSLANLVICRQKPSISPERNSLNPCVLYGCSKSVFARKYILGQSLWQSLEDKNRIKTAHDRISSASACTNNILQ